MRDRQIDLDRHLFAELERLGDEGLSAEELRSEIERARAIANVARQICDSRSLELRAQQFLDDRSDLRVGLPEGFREAEGGAR